MFTQPDVIRISTEKGQPNGTHISPPMMSAASPPPHCHRCPDVAVALGLGRPAAAVAVRQRFHAPGPRVPRRHPGDKNPRARNYTGLYSLVGRGICILSKHHPFSQLGSIIPEDTGTQRTKFFCSARIIEGMKSSAL